MLNYTTFYILAYTYLLFTRLLVTNLFIIFKTSSMGFISGEYPGHFRTGIPLYSRNVLVLLELLHGKRKFIKIYPFCGTTTHSNESVSRSHNYMYQRHYRVWHKQNESCYVYSDYCKIVSKCASQGSYQQQRPISSKKTEWYHGIAQNTRVILFMILEWHVNEKGYIFMHDLMP